MVATSFISGILGMAGGMILMGILLATMSVGSAMIVHGVTQLASNGWRAILWRQFIDRRIVVGYLIGLALAVALFALVSLVLSRPWVLDRARRHAVLTYLLPRNWSSTLIDRASRSAALSAWRCNCCPVCPGRCSIPSSYHQSDRKAVGRRPRQERNRSAISPRSVTSWLGLPPLPRR